jgi:hypothetical protein
MFEGFSEQDRERFFVTNAVKFYRLNLSVRNARTSGR